jgi:dihydroneopterin aldolase
MTVADSSGGAGLGDAILLENLQVPAALGVTAAEREMRRPVRIDLEVGRSLAKAGGSDRIRETLDYGEIYQAVERVAGGGEYRLVEALATGIAEALLAEFSIDWVRVEIRKAKPLAGVLEAAGVRITRTREG